MDQAGATGRRRGAPEAGSSGAGHLPGHEPNGGDVQVLAKPPVRKLAKDLGVDLRTLTPSGPEAR